ncbi:hypothetical protein STEG23_034777 [Scotinomys teguina]
MEDTPYGIYLLGKNGLLGKELPLSRLQAVSMLSIPEEQEQGKVTAESFQDSLSSLEMSTLAPADVHTCDPVVLIDDEKPYSMIGDPGWRESFNPSE